MIIRHMQGTFGTLDGEQLRLDTGLNIIYAPNESGKSTWCAFLRAMLYGIDTSQRARAGFVPDKQKYAPWSGKPMAGELELEQGGKCITIRRWTETPGAPLRGFSAVYTGTDIPVPGLTAADAGEQLTGVSAEVFARSAFIGQGGLVVTGTPELEKRIAYFRELLADPEKVKAVLRDELIAIRDKYGDERKTEIQDIEDDIDIEDLIEEEQCVFTLSHGGNIKRVPVDEYTAQKRGGKGVRAATLRDEDYVDTVFTASTHDYILFFTNRGRCYRKKGYLIPEAGRTARGVNIVNFIQVEKDEHVNAMLHVREMDDDSFLVFATRSGTVKRMPLSALRNIRTSGIRALTLDEGDELINVMRTDGSRNILLATHNGQAICFAETDVRPMGREAVGVRGIRLKDGDWVVGAEIAQPDADVLSITENGYGKRTPAADYIRGGEEPQHRGGSGMKNYNITDKTGPVAAVKVVQESDDVLVVSDDGVIIRMEAAGISELGRATQGVRIMRLSEGARVISVALTDRAESGDAAPAEEPEA